jgi:hypothetical protein
MATPTNSLIYVVLLFVLALLFLELALTGNIYARFALVGRARPLVKSTRLRAAFFVISIALFALVGWTLRNELAPLLKILHGS